MKTKPYNDFWFKVSFWVVIAIFVVALLVVYTNPLPQAKPITYDGDKESVTDFHTKWRWSQGKYP